MDPYERADIVSDQYDDWRVKNAYLMGEMGFHAIGFLQSFLEYPPSQLPASFSVDGVEDEIDKVNSAKLKPKSPFSGVPTMQ